MATTPQIENQLENITEIIQLPSKTYKLNINENNSDRIIGFIDKLEAIKQAIYHILMTERYTYLIYDDNYGIELQQYIGRGFDYLEATIEETLREALTIDLRITNVVVTDINKVNNDKAQVKFNVESIYGSLQMEVVVNV